MIDQKLQSLSKKNERNDMVLSSSSSPPAAMTSSSSFTHLSMMDTDDLPNCNGLPTMIVTNAENHHPCQNLQTAPINSTSYSFAMYDALDDICRNNIKYFECDDTEMGQRFSCAFRGIIDHTTVARKYVSEIVAIMHEYDFDESTPANGYRSYVKAMQACINHCVKICKYIAQNRSYLLFRKTMYMKEIEACCHLLASLCSCFQQTLTIKEKCQSGSLFPPGEHRASGLFNMSACVNQYSFYGRSIGFHYCESMQSVMKFLGICLAGFSEVYYNSNGNRIIKATSSMYTGGKYYWNPELRARRIINLSMNAGIDFCKSFWSLTENELMYALPNVFGVKIKVNRLITIPPEPLEIQSTSDPVEMVQIPIPSSHLGVGSVTARLLSNVRRTGMIGERNKKHIHPPSNSLIFHCHGGGFVAQSSKSHEIYLREWAAQLQVPILSIDYSLAPQAPYPRALEEVFYAYCWAIKNAKLLGTTAERIILVGDSAGATLNMALTLKCIDRSVRLPDGVLLIYSPMVVGFDPSPSRSLCLMDVLLPFGFLMGCLKAYVHPGKDQYLATPINSSEKDDDGGELKNGGEQNDLLSISTTSAVIVLSDECEESDMPTPTFVHIESEMGQDLIEPLNGKHTDGGGGSESGTWEHIQNDEVDDANTKSPMSDGTSDTFASASLHNSQTGGNTEMMTPDESAGISFEEDSQPITLHKPINECNGNDAFEICHLDEQTTIPADARRNSTSSSIVEMDGSNETPAKFKSSSTVPNHTGSKFVSDFVRKYGTDDLRGHGLITMPKTESEENVLLEEGRDALNMQNIPNKIYRAVETAANSVANTFNAITSPTVIRTGMMTPTSTTLNNGVTFSRSRLNSLTERNPADDYQFDIPRDPFLSPLYASDDMLKQLPPIKILTVEMDPFLDDCIEMAKRLKKLNKPVGIDVLPGLPHGFLSFVKLSKEAYEGNRLCMSRLTELLKGDPNC